MSIPTHIESLEPRSYMTAPKPDLLPTFVQPLPASAVAGTPTTVQLYLDNIGAADAKGKATISLYASTNNTLDPSDPLLTSLVKTLDIPHGSFSIQPLKFTPSSMLMPRAYHLFAKVMPTFSQAITTNDTAYSTSTLPFTAPTLGIDYSIGFKSALPLNFPFGSPNTVRVQLQNLGTSDATKPIRIGLYASMDKTFDSHDIYLTGTLYPTKLKSHATATLNLTFTTPSNFVPGAYYVAAKADTDNAVKESNESNNIIFSSLKIGF